MLIALWALVGAAYAEDGDDIVFSHIQPTLFNAALSPRKLRTALDIGASTVDASESMYWQVMSSYEHLLFPAFGLQEGIRWSSQEVSPFIGMRFRLQQQDDMILVFHNDIHFDDIGADEFQTGMLTKGYFANKFERNRHELNYMFTLGAGFVFGTEDYMFPVAGAHLSYGLTRNVSVYTEALMQAGNTAYPSAFLLGLQFKSSHRESDGFRLSNKHAGVAMGNAFVTNPNSFLAYRFDLHTYLTAKRVRDPDKVDVSNVPSDLPEKHPEVLRQPAQIANRAEVKAHLKLLLLKVKKQYAIKYPRKKAIRLGIASPVDAGGNLRPTFASNFVLYNLNAGAKAVGFKSLNVARERPAGAGKQPKLDSLISPLDYLFEGGPTKLWMPNKWASINPLLGKQYETSLDGMLLSKLRLSKDRKSLELVYDVIDLAGVSATKRVLMSGVMPIPLTRPIQQGADVFLLIDVSGSMSWNDPKKRRLAAAKFLLNELKAVCEQQPEVDFRVAAMFFNHKIESYSVTELLSLQEEQATRRLMVAFDQAGQHGATNLDVSFEYIKSHIIAKRMNRPLTVISFTDGRHTAGPLRMVWRDLHKYTQESISTVKGTAIALGAEPDNMVLQDLRNSLGGETGIRRISIENMSDIYDAFFQPKAAMMAKTSSTRTILKPKENQKKVSYKGFAGSTNSLQIIITPSKPRIIYSRREGP